MDALLRDVRYALRGLLRSPAFTIIAIVTIGLGIGANTAIFSVVQSVLLRPLPYDQPDQLTLVWGELESRNLKNFPLAPPTLRDLREQTTLFQGFAGVITFQQPLTEGDGDPEQVWVGGVTANIFSLLGVAPMLGRDFRPEDEEPIGQAAQADPNAIPPAAVILSHGLWQRRFGGDPNVVGNTYEIAGNRAEIVGVMPADFRLLMPLNTGVSSEIELWTALRINVENWPSRNNVLWAGIGRLKRGVSVEQGRAETDAVATRIREEDQLHETGGFKLELISMHADLTEEVRPVVLALLGAVAFVLLIACANVANLLLVRASSREREIAIRSALGGSRARLIRQLLVESSVMAIGGGVLGLVLAFGGIELLLTLRPANLPRIDTVGIDAGVLGFTLLASFVAAIVFGTIPAIQASKPDLTDSLKDRGRSSSLSQQRLFRNGVVVVEVALSVVLLIGAGLLVRSFVELQRVNPGFDPQNVLTFKVNIPGARLPTPEEQTNFAMQLQERLASIPGVESVSAGTPLPLQSGALFAGRYGLEEALTDESKYGQADYRIVLPGYLETMRTRLLAGRNFTRADFADSSMVVMVDEVLARKLWPDKSPVGERMLIRITTLDPQFVEVIGVVEHQRSQSLAVEGRETVYFTDRYAGGIGTQSYVMRSSVNPTSLTAQVRSEIRAVDPLLPVDDVRTMDEYMADAMAGNRFALVLIGIFGVTALVLASVGLYGVLAYVVRQRTPEIGVRMAFGAEADNILKLIVGQGAVLTLVGLVVGLIAAFWLTRFMTSMLVGVAPTDPLTFVAIAALFSGVALLAAYVPARRATLVDPVVALREE
jgi:putative ABC transport system permease protein